MENKGLFPELHRIDVLHGVWEWGKQGQARFIFKPQFVGYPRAEINTGTMCTIIWILFHYLKEFSIMSQGKGHLTTMNPFRFVLHTNLRQLRKVKV